MPPATWGYYLLEVSFRQIHCWPSTKGLRGFGAIIIISINFAFAVYPLSQKLKDFSTNYQNILYALQYHFLALPALWLSAVILIEQSTFHKMIDNFSDFNNFGIPNQLIPRNKLMKIVLKICDFAAFVVAFLNVYEALSDKSCLNTNSNDKFKNTCNFVIHYYLPFNIESWQLALIALYQTFSCYILGRSCMYSLLFFTYSFELLVIRMDDLINKIDNIHFTLGQKNDEEIKFIIKYHQHITRLFEEATNVMNKVVIPLKLCVLILISLSAVQITLGRHLAGFILFSVTTTLLFIKHATGQRIINKTCSLTDAIYDLNWYDADASLQKTVLNFLCVSQRQILIKLPVFGSASFPTMADEGKKIYAWFNWLTNFMIKKG